MKNKFKLVFVLLLYFLFANGSDAAFLNDDYRIELKNIEKQIKKLEKEQSIYTVDYINLQQNKYNVQIKYDKKKQAIKTSEDILKIVDNVYSSDIEALLNEYFNQFYFYLEMKEENSAKSLLDKIEKIVKSLNNHKHRYDYYIALANYYCNVESPFKALDAVNNIINYYDMNNTEKLDLIFQYAMLNCAAYNVKEAKRYLDDYYKLSVKLYGKDNKMLVLYYQALINLKIVVESDYISIPALYKELVRLTELNNYSSQMKMYNDFILIDYYLRISDFESAKLLLEKVENQIITDNCKIFKFRLNDLYIRYCALTSDIKNEKKYLRKALKLKNRKYSKNSIHSVYYYEKLVDYYKSVDRYRKANKVQIEILELLDENDLPVLNGKFLKNMALIKRDMKDFDEAIKYLDASEIEYKKELPEISYPLYETALEYAIVYRLFDRNEEAIPYYEKAKNICYKMFGQNHRDSLKIHLNMAESYSFIGKEKEAIENIDKAIEIAKNIYGPDNVNVINLQNKKKEIIETIKK